MLGGEGFIGRPFVEFLRRKGNQVDVFDSILGSQFDLRHVLIPNLSSYDACYFLAWDVGGSKYLAERSTWESQFRNNLMILSNTFPQLQHAKLKTVFVSSQLAGTDDSPYSLSKLIAQQYALELENMWLVRQWNVYGPLENYNLRSHAVSDFVYQALTSGKIVMRTSGLERRRFLHIEDLCDAYMAILDQRSQKLFDVAGSELVSIRQVAEIVAQNTGASVETSNSIGSTPNVEVSALIPGWNPKIKLVDGIKAMIEDAAERIAFLNPHL